MTKFLVQFKQLQKGKSSDYELLAANRVLGVLKALPLVPCRWEPDTTLCQSFGLDPDIAYWPWKLNQAKTLFRHLYDNKINFRATVKGSSLRRQLSQILEHLENQTLESRILESKDKVIFVPLSQVSCSSHRGFDWDVLYQQKVVGRLLLKVPTNYGEEIETWELSEDLKERLGINRLSIPCAGLSEMRITVRYMLENNMLLWQEYRKHEHGFYDIMGLAEQEQKC